MTDAGWCTIESDPAVFTEMMEQVGVKNVGVEEIISLEPEMLQMLTQPIKGLILLFKWSGKGAQTQRNVVPEAPLFFAKQIVHNACATQAIVNILLNHTDSVEVGEALSNLHGFTAEMDPTTRGEMIGQADVLRSVHNSFARQTVFSFEDRPAKENDDVYHFISYIHKDGVVWELDGLQEGPIFIEPAEEKDWLATASSAIQARMREAEESDKSGQGQGISFSLMAVTASKIAQLTAQIAALQAAGDAGSAAALQEELTFAEAQKAKGHVENVRRKHNYIPMLVKLLQSLANKDALRPLISEASIAATDKAKKN
jgi:ubiquitin carboxyl-terminal hydrolase L5